MVSVKFFLFTSLRSQHEISYLPQSPETKEPAAYMLELLRMAGDTPVFSDKCKWSKKPVGTGIVKNLRRKASLLISGNQKGSVRLGLFSQSGFTREVEDLSRKGELKLVDIRKIGL